MRLLYITNSTNENNTLGYRHSRIIEFLNNNFNLDVVNFEFTKKNQRFIRKAINKLAIFPDIYMLSLYKYKKVIQDKINHNFFDLVIICVLPHSFLALATYIKSLNVNIKVVVDMTDPLSINVSYINYWHIYRLYIKWFEEIHLKNVNMLIVLNDEIKQYYEHYYPFIKHIIVIEQGTDPIDKVNDLQTFDNKRELRMVYAGMFYIKTREPSELYKSIGSIKRSLRLSIYGSFKKRFMPPQNDRFHYGGLIDKHILKNKLIEFDVIVFFDNFYGLQIPGKLIEILETKKPILFIYENDYSPTLKYIKEYNGIYFAKNNAQAIIKAIEDIHENGTLIYERDLSKYYWNYLVNKLSDYIINILKN